MWLVLSESNIKLQVWSDPKCKRLDNSVIPRDPQQQSVKDCIAGLLTGEEGKYADDILGLSGSNNKLQTWYYHKYGSRIV